jgi:hypothetical protein
MGDNGPVGRDIQAVEISGEDRRVYDERLRRSLEGLARMLRERAFEDGPSQVGLEIELNLVGEQAGPAMRNRFSRPHLARLFIQSSSSSAPDGSGSRAGM